jgi:RNA polymerase sigma-70 factor, ECF subfamily
MRALSIPALERSSDRTLPTAGLPADAELVARAREGESWATEALFRRHIRAVGNLALRMLRNPEDADDVVQDTFAVALDKLDSLKEPEAFRAWLFSIAVRHVHRRLRRRRLLTALGFVRMEETTLADLAAPNLASETRAELALLDRALLAVPLADRLPWMLRHVEGEPLATVAAICGCSLATVKRRIGRAELAIQRHLGGSR